MRRTFINCLLLASLSAVGAPAATSIWSIEPTATQALVRVATDQGGACTYRVSASQSFSPLVYDVDPTLYAGSNSDSRPGSSADGSYHIFVLGRRTAAQASDGRRYSRALQAATTYWVGATCGTDTEFVRSFQTQTPPLGQAYPESAPFDASGFGNYAWPSIDFGDQSKTYVDPMTGLALKRITAPGWNFSRDHQNNTFAYVFDLHAAWTNASSALNWPGTNNLASYTGGGSDPLFVATDFSTVSDYQYGAMAISGWSDQTSIDDILLRTYGLGSDPAAANRNILVCLSVDSGQSCSTPEIAVTLPAGSAASGPTAPASSGPGGFPKAMMASWATVPPFSGRDFGTVITTVTTAGNTITNTGSQSSQYFSRAWKAGGKVLVNGSEVYTIATVTNSTTLTTIETMTTHTGAVTFKSLCAGMRLRKQTATGSISLSAGYDFATSGEFNAPFTGVRSLCSQIPVTVTTDANGNPAPARSARLCALQSGVSHAVFAFFSDTGESRLLSNLAPITGYQYHAPDWQQYDGNIPFTNDLTVSDVWDATVGTQFYSYMKLGTHYVLVRVNYTGNFQTYRPYPATNGYYTTGFWPDDQLTYTIVGGYPSNGRAVDQQTAAFGNKYFDPAQWNLWSFTGLLPGGIATWEVGTQCCNENPVFFVLQDVTTGNVVKVIDTISTYPMRFWGNHSTQVTSGYYAVLANILGNKGTSTSNYLGGYFILYPTQIQKSGVWSADTSLTATYADSCPTSIAPQWQAAGATGMNCILMQAKQPCSSFAGPAELANYPCPWDPTKSMVSTLAAGDRFWLEFPPLPGSGESIRVVTDPVDVGGGVAQFWGLRHSEKYSSLGGNYGGSGDAHPNGWTAAMIPPEARTNAQVYISPNGTVYSENYTASADHSAIGPGLSSGLSTSALSGATPSGQYISAYGIRWNQPFTSQVGKLPDYNVYRNGRFAGLDYGGGAIETYPSMEQLGASTSEKRWLLDFRHMNPSAGVGLEVYSGVGSISASPASGTSNVYRFTAYPGNHGDVKRFPAIAYAGPYLLKDISGAASQISDATAWSFCFVYKAGECRPGSAAGEVYTSVPHADTRGIQDGQCISGWYAQTNPCVMIPPVVAGWTTQVDVSRPQVDDNYWRKLTRGFSGIGRQYQFGTITPVPDGSWAFLQCYWCDGQRNEMFGVKLPPFPAYDTVNRADFVPVRVGVAPGYGAGARVRFGYAENGPESSFFCSSRQEACLTDNAASPFAYATSDVLSPTPCQMGCSINIPGVSGRIVYYQVERVDSTGRLLSADPVTVSVVP